MDWLEYENKALSNGHKYVCGVDEAGRGPLAGPVCAAAVILPEGLMIDGVNDSKKLSEKKRELLFEELFAEEQRGKLCIRIGQASCEEIDNLNILQATFLAMKRATENLHQKPDMAIIDGNRIPTDFVCPAQCVIKGDAKSLSISAASIVAKVYRDRIMKEMAQKYPYYGFEKNAGYGTKSHIEGLKQYGITPEHRKSYKPIQEFMKKITY